MMATTVKKDQSQARVVPGALIVLVTIGIIALPWPLMSAGLCAVALVALSELLKIRRDMPAQKLGPTASITIETVLVITMPVVLVYVGNNSGRAALTLVIFGIFVSDVAAFYGGRKFGKTKLATSISPGKTYEGVLCGLIGGVAVSAIVWGFANLWPEAALPQPLGTTVLLMIALVLCGIVGDLNESYLKRRANIKDSGTFLQGHGGMLDRIDSLLTAGLLAALFVSAGWL